MGFPWNALIGGFIGGFIGGAIGYLVSLAVIRKRGK